MIKSRTQKVLLFIIVGITGFDRRSRSEDTIEIKIYYYPRNLPLCENLLCLK